jgi:histone H3/H4
MEYLVTEAFTKARKDKRKTVYYRDLGIFFFHSH